MHLVGSRRVSEPVIKDIERLIHETGRLKRMFQRLGQQAPGESRDRSANWLLFAIWRHGPIRLAELATATYIDASTASRQTADLVDRGLLMRQADPADGRASLLALTDAGERAVRDLIRAREEFFTTALADWEPDDIRQLAELLGRFADAIGNQADRPADDKTSEVRKVAP